MTIAVNVPRGVQTIVAPDAVRVQVIERAANPPIAIAPAAETLAPQGISYASSVPEPDVAQFPQLAIGLARVQPVPHIPARAPVVPAVDPLTTTSRIADVAPAPGTPARDTAPVPVAAEPALAVDPTSDPDPTLTAVAATQAALALIRPAHVATTTVEITEIAPVRAIMPASAPARADIAPRDPGAQPMPVAKPRSPAVEGHPPARMPDPVAVTELSSRTAPPSLFALLHDASAGGVPVAASMLHSLPGAMPTTVA